MNYDANKHIKHGGLAAEAGIRSTSLTGLVRSGKAPAPVGKERIGRSVASYYDRTEALLWAAKMRPQATGETVPPSDINLMTRETWKPKGRLADNFARASEVYPHRLITPVGTGNDKEFSPFYGKGK